MATGPDSIEALLHRYDHDPLPAAERWDIGKRAERLAEAEGDADALYAIRMRLVESAHLVTDARAQLALFLWCAHKHDSDPGRYPTRPVADNPNIDLLWFYKWLTGMMSAWPQYSLTQIRSAIDMMRGAYQREGAGRSGVLWAEFHLANEAGTDDDVRETLAKIRTTPVDEYSNCDACSRASEIGAMAALDDKPRALRLFDDLLAGGYSCAEEPETIISECLGLLLQSGRHEEAVMLQERSYPRIMSGPGHLAAQLHHTLFFLDTGNPAKAYELLCRHLPGVWHEGLPPASQLGALTMLVRIATLLAQAGHGNLPLPGTHAPEARRLLEGTNYADGATAVGPYTLDRFIPLAHARAHELAAQFDARNGHTRSANALASAADPEHTVVPIDLGGKDFPESGFDHSTALIPSSEVDAGTFRAWMDLAYELTSMEGVQDSGRSVRNALSLAKTPAERFEACVHALQLEDLEDAPPILDAFVALMREQGYGEYADAAERYGHQLWHAEPGSISNHPSAKASPLPDISLDPALAIREAHDPLWRLTLALLLLRQVSESSTENLVEASAHLTATLDAPETEWGPHAEALHTHLATQLESGATSDPHELAAYALAHARISGFTFAFASALRDVTDALAIRSTSASLMVRLLHLRASATRSLGSTALELDALRLLPEPGADGNTNSDSGAARTSARIEELTRTTHHPYRAIAMRCIDARNAAQRGDHARATELIRTALMTYTSCEHLRPSMSSSEQAFISRATLLEHQFTIMLDAGNASDTLAAGNALASHLRSTHDVDDRDYRLASVLHRCSYTSLATGTGDIHTIIDALNEASGIVERTDCESIEWLFLRADVFTAQAHVHALFHEASECLSKAHSAADALDALPADVGTEVVPRYMQLASTVSGFDAALARTWLGKVQNLKH